MSTGVKIWCNWGVLETATKANFGILNVWYDDGAIVNIFLLQQVAEMYPINFKMNDQGGNYIVSTKMGELIFLPHPKGLYYLDMGNLQDLQYKGKTPGNNHGEAIFMIDTMRRNVEGYTK